MSRTVAPAPLDDRSYWRRLIAAVHPDRTGDPELILFAQGVREHVEGCRGDAHGGDPGGHHRQDRRQDRHQAEPTPRVPYPARVDHVELWLRANRYGHELVGPVASLLLELRDYEQATSGRGQLAEQRGCSYKQLKYQAVLAEIPARALYDLGERLPMSQAMAGRLIARLKERGAHE